MKLASRFRVSTALSILVLVMLALALVLELALLLILAVGVVDEEARQQCWKTNSQSSGAVMDTSCWSAEVVVAAACVSTLVATYTIALYFRKKRERKKERTVNKRINCTLGRRKSRIYMHAHA